MEDASISNAALDQNAAADGAAPAEQQGDAQFAAADGQALPPVVAAALAAAAAEAAATPHGVQRITPGPDGVVTLPAGVALDDIHIQGRDLVIHMPDGTNLIIVDGAVLVPQLVIGNVEVPPQNLAALLIGQEPKPAAGPPSSSGGNFAVPVGNIGPEHPLGDLLPPTEFGFPQQEQEEILPGANKEPDVIIITPDDQTGATDAMAEVNEAGLPARGSEPQGSNAAANSETTTGTLVITPGNGDSVVTLNGEEVTGVGQQIAGDHGILTITSFSDTAIGYSYTLGDNTSGDTTSDVFAVTVTDEDGDTATADLTVHIIDDVPTARDDVDTAGSGPLGAAAGNVFTGVGTDTGAAGADTPGADDAHVTGIHAGDVVAPFAAVSGAVQVHGTYGVLTINPDGTYLYVKDPGQGGGVEDVFTYQLTDGDGDTSDATLTIIIPDQLVVTPFSIPNNVLDDDSLAGGNPGTPAVGDDVEGVIAGVLTPSSGDPPFTFHIETTGAPDGFTYVASGDNKMLIQQNGITVVTVTLDPVTGAYSVVNNAPIMHPAGDLENNVDFPITVSVTDVDGDTGSATAIITVDDDTPIAADDTDTVSAAQTSATGNVITDASAGDSGDSDTGADSAGADGGGIVVGVASNNVPANVDTSADGSGDFQVAGQYGNLLLNQDGSYTYDLTANPNAAVHEVFTYTLTDADGDTTTATLTIDIDGRNHPVAVLFSVPVNVLDDDSLAGGNPGTPAVGDDVEGIIAGVLTPSSGDPPYTFHIDTTGAPAGFTYVAQGDDTMLIKQGSVIVVTVTLDPDTGAYSVVNNNPIMHPPGNLENNVDFPITVTVTDVDGDTGSATAIITVDDDTPIAANDTDSVSIAQTSATGNVITDLSAGDAGDSDTGADSDGADGGGAVVGVVSINIPANGDTDATGGFQVTGQYGDLVLNPDGSYTYDLTGNPLTAVQEKFTYTLTDADGDTTTATLTIDIAGRNSVPVVGDNEQVLLDDDVPGLGGNNDSAPGDDSPDTDNLTGTLSGSGGDGSLTWAFQTNGNPAGFTYQLSGNDILIKQGGDTVITVTLNTATGAYTVTQNLPIDHATGDTENNQLFTLHYTVEDGNGDTVPGTISINVDDDMPAQVEEGLLTLNVEEDDINNSQSVGNNEDGSVGANTDTGSLGGLVSIGADVPGTFSFALAVEGDAVKDGNGDPVTSKGDAVLYHVNGTTLTGYADDGVAGYQGTERSVFTMTITDTSTGAVSFTIVDQVDHATADGENTLTLDLGDALQVTDNDGDTIALSGQVNVNVQDDIPVGPAEAPNCDDNITDNDPDAPDVTNNLGVSIGTDEPMIISSITGPSGITAGGGFEVQYNFDSVTHTLTGFIDTNGGSPGGIEDVLTVVIDPSNGDYTFDLLMALDGVTTTVAITGGTDTGAGPTAGFLATDAGDNALGLVVGWTVDTFDPNTWSGNFTQAEVNRSANGYGVEDANVDDGTNATDDGDLIRFDFGAADSGPGGYSPPVPFDGPPVDSATFTLKNFQAADSVWYKVTYINPDGSVASTDTQEMADPSTGTLTLTAPSGDFIGQVEFYVQDGNGFIDLSSVDTLSTAVDQCLDFGVNLTDYDGDPLGTDIHVTVQAAPIEVRGAIHLTVAEAALDTAVTGDDDSGDLQAALVTGSDPDSTAETDSDTGITFVAGNDPIDSVLFSDPDVVGNEPNIVGLDDGVIVDWSLADAGRTLIGTIGGDTAIILHLTGSQTTVNPGDTLSPTVTVTITDAWPDQDAPNASEIVITDVEVVAHDSGGGENTGLVDVTITDDVPLAVNDGTTTIEGAADSTGNVIDNDTVGADAPGTVTGIRTGEEAGSGTGGTVGNSLAGDFGTLTLNADGSYTYTPNASVPSGSIDHFTYTLTDADGDTDTAELNFTFEGDANTPSAGEDEASVDDDGLPDGNHDSATGDLVVPNGDGDNNESTFGGTLTHNFGGDGAGGIGFASMDGDGGTIGQENVTYAWDGGTNTLTATIDGGDRDNTDLYKVVVDPNTGDYTVTLLQNVMHLTLDGDPGDDTENDASASLTFTVTDSDGSTADGTLSVTFDDDIPVATDAETTQASEGDPVTVDVNANYDPGADGVDLATGIAIVDASLSGSGNLDYNGDGTFTYTPAAGEQGDITFDFSVTDADGDTVTATATIHLAADSTPTAGTVNAAVDDDGLVPGDQDDGTGDDNILPDPDNNEATFSGTLTGNVGGDTPATFDFASMNLDTDSLGTENIHYEWDGGTKTLTAIIDGGPRDDTALFKVQVTDTATGAYTVTLLQNVLHADTGDTENNDSVSLTYTVSDSDSPADTADGTLNIDFDDDMPIAANDADTATEGGPAATGNVITDLAAGDAGDSDTGADDIGADLNGTVTAIRTGTEAGSGSGGTVGVALVGQFGSLTLNSDGSYSYTPNASVPSGSIDHFTYTVTDADGDSDTAELNITFSGDANTPTAGTDAASVDDDGLPAGNHDSATGDLVVPNGDGDNNESTFGGTLTHNFGGDTPGTIDFASMDGDPGTIGQENVTYHWNGGTNTLTAEIDGGARDGTDLYKVVVNPTTGAYTLTLLQDVMHLTLNGGPGDNEENDATAALTFTVTDSDGSTADGTLNVTFDDDIPVAANDADTATEGGANATGNVITDLAAGDAGDSDTGADNIGADLDGTVIAIRTGTEAGSGTAGTVGNALVGTYGSLTLNADGSYTYTPNANVPSGSVDHFTYTVTDADGDSDTAELNITFSGDGNIPTAGTVAASVDDDGLTPNGNNDSQTGDLVVPNGDADNNESTFGGTLTHNYGGDGAGSIDFASMDLDAGTIGQENVIYHWDSGTNTLRATINGGTRNGTDLYKVEVTDAVTGTYKVTLLQNVQHLTLNGIANDDTENDATAALTFTVHDSDNSTADGTLNLTFDDDMPKPYTTAPGTATGENEAGTIDTESLNLPAVGADRPGALGFGVADGTAALDADSNALTDQNGQELYYTRNTLDPSILEARTSATPGGGTLVFSIDLNDVTGQYTYHQYGQISVAQNLPISNLSSVGGGNNEVKGISGSTGPLDLILTTQPGNTINTSATEIGVGGGNSMGAGENIRFDFVMNVAETASHVTTYGEYYSANAFRQDVSGLSGAQKGNFIVRVVDVAEGPGGVPADPADGNNVFYGDANDTFQTNGGPNNLALHLYNGLGTLVAPSDYASLGIAVTALANGFQVTGLPNNYDYEITSDMAFEAVQLEATAGTGTFKLGAMTISALTIEGSTFEVPVTLTDSDGDTVTNNITVDLSAPTPPIVLDLDGDGVEFIAKSSGVAFDYAGDGTRDPTAWVGKDDGILVHDANGDGKANDGSEIVFADPANGADTDLEGLALHYDTNGDGMLSAADADFAKFGVWQDANSNGVTDAGEFKSLAELGIVSIDLTSDGKAYSAAGGDVQVNGQTTYTKANGSTGIVADVSFRTSQAGSTSTLTSAEPKPGTGLADALVAAGLIATIASLPQGPVAWDVPLFHDTAGHDGTVQSQVVAQGEASTSHEARHSLAIEGQSAHGRHAVETNILGHQQHGADTDQRHGGAHEGDHGPQVSQLLAATTQSSDQGGQGPDQTVDINAIQLTDKALAKLAHVGDHDGQNGGNDSNALAGGQQQDAGDGSPKVGEVIADALRGGHGGGHDIQALLDHLAPTGEHGLHALQQLHLSHEAAVFGHGGMHGANPLAAMEVHAIHAPVVVTGHA